MTKGVPSQPRRCLRCGQTYRPTSGPQRYCVQCRPIMHKVYAGQWAKRHPKRRREIDERARKKNPERLRQLGRYNYFRWKDNLTLTVMEHYSNGLPKCACCGESERDFLAIDHIDGHGSAHRRKTFGRQQGGVQIYYWLINQGFPPGFQVLCFNCNMSKAKHGKCVHVARPVLPIRPPDVKLMNRTPDLKPRGDEGQLVKWRPRTWEESQPFKESSKVGKNPG